MIARNLASAPSAPDLLARPAAAGVFRTIHKLALLSIYWLASLAGYGLTSFACQVIASRRRGLHGRNGLHELCGLNDLHGFYGL